MPVSYSIAKVGHLVVVECAADPTYSEFEAAMLAAFRDPGFRPNFSFLLDRGGIEEPPSIEYVTRVAEFIRHHAGRALNGRVAIVVKGAASYGMARMAQGLAGDLPTEMAVFGDRDSALDWLHNTG
jgi:hypothetical protein